ncbi:HAMP domain-containing sensor histidine kinase [Cohnella thermotolerans]|uniref:HAMP domain-containing sensor histidine kinase n=1 Tax=Cohnella thermotolerans TaxID=329858 RepID=UPI0003FAB89A|nr:HAMP domain-containing sensor histidine kinase [Cohnella thermotolerans]
MIRTLYFRVVFTFMIAVIVGLVSAFFLTVAIYKDRLQNMAKEQMREQADIAVEMLSELHPDQMNSYLDFVSRISGYRFEIYDSTGKLAASDSRTHPGGKPIDPKLVQSVLSGQHYEADSDPPVVGISFVSDGQRAAFFVQQSDNRRGGNSLLSSIVFTALVIVLAAGSLCIFVWAHYLVKPLKAMKQAADRMSRGEFDIEFNWKRRKDEVGALAASFARMAGELKQLEEMRQNFVSNVSHEIQSPLTSISGFSKVLLKKELPEKERKRYLTIIHEESERLSRLSDNLLKLASLDSEHHPFNPTVYDLDEQIRGVVLACEPQWSAKNLEIDLNLPRVKIVADEDLLSLVWTNLIGNSIKFTPEGGWISVSIRKDVHSIDVTIADNGIGIPEEARKRVFERFYKVDAARNKKLSGSGLGLAIAHKIVTFHKGRIRIDGGPEGGTVVRLSFPVMKY